MNPPSPAPSTHMIRTTVLALALAASFGVAAKPVSYQLDPNHTVVLASWTHFGYSHPSANFGQASGTLSYDADDVAKSNVEVTLPLCFLAGGLSAAVCVLVRTKHQKRVQATRHYHRLPMNDDMEQ